MFDITYYTIFISGIRAFANSHSDQDLTKNTDVYIQCHIDEITKGLEIKALPSLQLDILGNW